MGEIDLHLHTLASDGLLTADALVEEAAKAGLRVLAITDHDSLESLPQARQAAARYAMEIITGIEMSTQQDGEEVHILGYFMNEQDQAFQALLADQRRQRRDRAARMCAALAAQGVVVSLERVEALAQGGAVGRPHVARALMEIGAASSVDDAFKKWLGKGRPGYVKSRRLTPAQACEAIRGAGGVPVLAHPGLLEDDGMIPSFIAQGLQGLEVRHSDHSPALAAHYEALAGRHGLVKTGGSDFHGDRSQSARRLGVQQVPREWLQALRAQAAANQAPI